MIRNGQAWSVRYAHRTRCQHHASLASIFLTLTIIMLCLAATSGAQQDSRAHTGYPGGNDAAASAKVRARADGLLNEMTVDEKIAQLVQLPGFPVPQFAKNADGQKMEQIIETRGTGSILWVSDPKEIDRLQHIAVEKSRLHIPILFGLDVIHGYRTIFPSPIAGASSWDPKMIEEAQAIAAKEARAAGIDWTFSPMVDIARDARWGRMVEGAGEDPYLGSAIARAQVLGFQGREWGSPDHVLAVRQAFRRIRCRRRWARLRRLVRSRRIDVEPLSSAVQSGARCRRRHVHERLHGFERRTGDRQSLPAPRRAALRRGTTTASSSATRTLSTA